MNLSETLTILIGYFDASGFPWAVIGGLAVSARAVPRFTLDADIAVAVDTDADAERLVGNLREVGFTPVATMEQDYVERLAGVRLIAGSNGGFEVDLLFASSGIEPEIARDASRIELVPGLVAPVAQLSHLLALKLLSRDPRRPQDDVDLQSLLNGATPADIATARDLMVTITERGFARGKDLYADFDAIIQRFGERNS